MINSIKKTILGLVFMASIGSIGCGERGKSTVSGANYTPEQIKVESKRVNDFLEKSFDDYLIAHPQLATYLGDKRNADKWNNITEAALAKEEETAQRELSFMRDSLNPDALDAPTAVSYKMMMQLLEERTENIKWHNHQYLINQMFGMQSDIPAFLINMHKIENEADATAYLKRIDGILPLFGDLVTRLEASAEQGIIPPTYILDKCLDASTNITKGFPLEKIKTTNELYADFDKKLADLVAKKTITAATKTALTDKCVLSMQTAFLPAYTKLIATINSLKAKADETAGVWKMPDGEDYYAFCLRKETTTSLTPAEIHTIGLKEVARIHKEMQEIMQQVKFKGTMQDFFQFMRTDKQFYYPETPKGKNSYVVKATAIIDSMRVHLPQLFITMPKAPLVVKQVEPFREKTAGSAFYDSPAPDGSRPGTYYLNTYDMSVQSDFEMEALAYHEGIPGHHMQLAIAQEMTTLPRFRRFSEGYTAYVEGWGLYSEFIPKEMGFYKNPYSDFGRLSMELFRACRLVVDTGIHWKKWTRQQGIDYYKQNTPTAETEIFGMVDRHIVMPGQATAYKLGMMKIIELRDKAKKELGSKFDIRDYHEVVLTNGAVPLDILEELVQEYIDRKK